MAKNRQPEKTMESEQESGEEDNEEASSEEVGSSESYSEPEQTETTNKSSSLPVAAVKKTQQQPDSSSDEEESGSELESDSDGADLNIRPIAFKPMEDPQKFDDFVMKPRSKTEASESVTPAKSTGVKRLTEGSLAEGRESEAKDAKRSRKKLESEIENTEKRSNDNSKKQLFQRLWSEDDEIAILKGMIDYMEKNKSDPVADLNSFHDFIKDNLHVDVTRTQLQDKIRRLKKKYENNKSKEKEGKDRTFTKPHEQKTYELSKHIWRNENGNKKVESTPKADGTSVRKTRSANAIENGENEDANNLEVDNGDVDMLSAAKILISNNLSIQERILRAGDELFEGDKYVEEAREWRKLRVEEVEVYLKKLELMRAQTRLVLDVLGSSDL